MDGEVASLKAAHVDGSGGGAMFWKTNERIGTLRHESRAAPPH